MNFSLRLPVAASVALHGCAVALLIVLAGRLPPVALPVPNATGGIAIMLAPPELPSPVVEPPPAPAEPPPIPEAETPPPEPPSPVVAAEPPPPPQPKPVAKPQPRRPSQQPAPAHLQTAVAPLPAPPSPPPQTPIAPMVSAGYRAALSGWLEAHKRYPDGARERGDEGRAVLRFRVDRSGRVLDHAIVQGTGHPDLDAALDRMMQGATLPPFPADMAASDIEVSVAIRFALAR